MPKKFSATQSFKLSSPNRSVSLPPTKVGGTPVGQPKRGGNSWTRFRQENKGLDMPHLREKYQAEKKPSGGRQGGSKSAPKSTAGKKGGRNKK